MEVTTKRSAKQTWARAWKILEAAKARAKLHSNRDAESQLEYISTASEYAEPGYSGEFIAFGNWNSISRYNRAAQRSDELPSKVCVLLEKLGFECEWSDEWDVCDCGKAVRTSPDSYSWQAYYHIDDSGITCGDCVKDDPESYLESLEGSTDSCVTIDGIDPEQHGYRAWNGTYETGFHPGQNDDPKKVAVELRKLGYKRFLFAIDHNEQFCTMWKTYVHESEYEAEEPEEDET